MKTAALVASLLFTGCLAVSGERVRVAIINDGDAPRAAVVRIDGETVFWGHVGHSGGEGTPDVQCSFRLAAGTHHVEILRDGKPAHQFEVTVKPGVTNVVIDVSSSAVTAHVRYGEIGFL